MDEEKLLPGQKWNDEIENALEITDAVIVTLSTGSVSKEGYVQKDLKFALDIALQKPEDTIFILPVRLDDCNRPRSLRSIHGVDYFPPEHREQAYARILKSLELRAKSLEIDIEKGETTTNLSRFVVTDLEEPETKRVPADISIKDEKRPINSASVGQARIKIILNPWSDPTILASALKRYQDLAAVPLSHQL